MSLWTDANWRVLIDAFEGRLSSDGADHFEQWVAAHPGRADAVARVRAAWEIAGYPVSRAWPLDEMFAEVGRGRRAARAMSGAPEVSTKPGGRAPAVGPRARTPGRIPPALLRSRSWRPAAVAAAAAGVIIAGVVLRDAPAPDRRGGTSYATGVGQRAIVTLRDGTRVTLAPATTLRVDPGFGTHTRAVALSGAAWFDVPGAARAPFVVRTGAVTTRVLGTTFTVARYPGDGETRVAVVSGKVLMSAATPRHPSIVLAAGTVGVVTDSAATTVMGVAADTSWTSGRLVFYKAPTAEVLAMLTRWYGYRFRLTDSTLARQNLTVGISTESAAAALATLKLALDADLSYADGVVTLSPRRGGPRDVPKARDGRDAFSPHIREVGR